jgi:hypothetical protein
VAQQKASSLDIPVSKAEQQKVKGKPLFSIRCEKGMSAQKLHKTNGRERSRKYSIY